MLASSISGVSVNAGQRTVPRGRRGPSMTSTFIQLHDDNARLSTWALQENQVSALANNSLMPDFPLKQPKSHETHLIDAGT